MLAALDAAINTTPPRAVIGPDTRGRGRGSDSAVAMDLRQSPTAVSDVVSSVANGVWRAVDNDTPSSNRSPQQVLVASTPAAVAVAEEAAALSTPSHQQQSPQPQAAATCTPS